MKIYISASIINAPINLEIAEALRKEGNTVFLPQTFCPESINHEQFPIDIYEQCIKYMEECDLGLILLDSYERDSSWECGWFAGKNKQLIGLVEKSLKFRQDWMIKGGINKIIALNNLIYNELLKDIFFKENRNEKVVYCDDYHEVSIILNKNEH